MISPETSGSLQNPAWSPDGKQLLLTRFRDGYNMGPADLFRYELAARTFETLVSDGSANVNLPGSCWNAATQTIVFSSSREPHDEIYTIPATGKPGEEKRTTQRTDRVAYEPSFSPDGQWVVFESHRIDVEDNGVIMKHKSDGTGLYVALTGLDEDCRQPNWSPIGNSIVYQRFADNQWDLWVTDDEAGEHRQLTTGSGDKTDASFSPDGRWIVYSSDAGGLAFANLYIIPVSGGDTVRITNHDGYDGAPSWSPDGSSIAFESYEGDPDGSPGTTIWTVPVQTP